MRARRRVAVLAPELARALFGTADPLGRYVRADGVWHQVVGVLDEPRRPDVRSTPAEGLPAGGALFVPLDAMDRALGHDDAIDRVQEIVVQVNGAAAVEPAQRAAHAFLRRQHPGEAAWDVVTPRALLAARLRAQRTFDLVVLALGALALLVSGVGIMNVMLAAVAERTLEIGVRRAVGAPRWAILAQFAMEAAALCLAGGPRGCWPAPGCRSGWPGWRVGRSICPPRRLPWP